MRRKRYFQAQWSLKSKLRPEIFVNLKIPAGPLLLTVRCHITVLNSRDSQFHNYVTRKNTKKTFKKKWLVLYLVLYVYLPTNVNSFCFQDPKYMTIEHVWESLSFPVKILSLPTTTPNCFWCFACPCRTVLSLGSSYTSGQFGCLSPFPVHPMCFGYYSPTLFCSVATRVRLHFTQDRR